ncbi:MAG: hypothetical protein KKA68_21075 [Gammaproteobacteria bacterium]|nr:hypothetical protein [Gammaproteobacteria bacterium]
MKEQLDRHEKAVKSIKADADELYEFARAYYLLENSLLGSRFEMMAKHLEYAADICSEAMHEVVLLRAQEAQERSQLLAEAALAGIKLVREEMENES